MTSSQATPLTHDEPPAMYLARIRAQTCYGTFRAVATVLVVAGVLGAIAQGSWGLLVLLGPGPAAFPAGLAALISAPLSLCLVLLGHHWLLLQADLADIQIDAHRTHGLNPPSQFTQAAAESTGSLLPWLGLALVIVLVAVWLVGR